MLMWLKKNFIHIKMQSVLKVLLFTTSPFSGFTEFINVANGIEQDVSQ